MSSLWGKLSRSKEYRESFATSFAKRMIPLQIRVLRKQRGPEWSQARLAKESKLTQGVISRAEDPDYGNLTVNTLARIAAGFDCAFIGRFISFSDLAKWYSDLSDEKTLEVPSFETDIIAARKGAPTTQYGSSLTRGTCWSMSIDGQAIRSRDLTRDYIKYVDDKKVPPSLITMTRKDRNGTDSRCA